MLAPAGVVEARHHHKPARAPIALGVSESDDKNIAAVDAYTAAAGRAPAVWAVWSDWGGPDQAFPTSFMNLLKQRHIVPMVNWEPVDPSAQTDCTNWSLDAMIKGNHDAYIRQWAQDAKNYGGTVILRFAHEMNGYWFPWGYGRCTNTPAKFKTAWKHVWGIFNSVGATNVQFLWSVLGAHHVRALYPGAKYVDYVGLTAFDWGPPKRKWTSMVKTFNTSMRILSRYKKPIIAAEIGAAYLPSCRKCDKVAYITNGYPAVYKKWPRLAVMVYFDLNMSFVAQPDWRLSSPPGALSAYRQIVADPRFQGTIN